MDLQRSQNEIWGSAAGGGAAAAAAAAGTAADGWRWGGAAAVPAYGAAVLQNEEQTDVPKETVVPLRWWAVLAVVPLRWWAVLPVVLSSKWSRLVQRRRDRYRNRVMVS